MFLLSRTPEGPPAGRFAPCGICKTPRGQEVLGKGSKLITTLRVSAARDLAGVGLCSGRRATRCSPSCCTGACTHRARGARLPAPPPSHAEGRHCNSKGITTFFHVTISFVGQSSHRGRHQALLLILCNGTVFPGPYFVDTLSQSCCHHLRTL